MTDLEGYQRQERIRQDFVNKVVSNETLEYARILTAFANDAAFQGFRADPDNILIRQYPHLEKAL